MNILSDEQITLETKSIFRPLAIESGTTILPLSDLGDREFELLSYLLVSSELKKSEFLNFDNISLMQGVAERGRDCVLYHNSKIVGLVQCKKYNGRLTKPQTIKEIIKFILFSILDKTILPDPNNFEYNLYVSNDLNGVTIELLSSFNDRIKDEFKNGNIEKYTNDLISEYESFKSFEGNIPLLEIQNLLTKIKVTYQNGIDLTSRILNNSNVLSMFFNIKTVVDLESNDKYIRKALDDYGLTLLTDKDLKILKKRIENTQENNRINLGFMDFFGYSKEFFDFLQVDNKFKNIVKPFSEMQNQLNEYLMDFLSNEISKSVFNDITMRLLNTGKIHRFSVGIAQPYLWTRLSKNILIKSSPKEILKKLNPDFFKSKEELILQISNYLFKTSEEILNGDYSNLVGDNELVQMKLRLYEHIHQGITNIEEIKLIFNKDIKLLIPILDNIENRISSLITEERTIVIKDGSFLENKEELENIKKTLDKLKN